MSTNKLLSSLPISESLKCDSSSDFILCGKKALLRLSSYSRFSTPPALNAKTFLEWAQNTVTKKLQSKDKEFYELVRVRELKKAHLTMLTKLGDELNHAEETFSKSPHFNELTQLDKEITGGLQAIDNMRRFLLDSPSDETNSEKGTNNPQRNERKERLRVLLPLKEGQVHSNILQRDHLIQTVPEYNALINAKMNYEQFIESIGLNSAMQQLNSSNKRTGRMRNIRGKTFEEIVAVDVLQDHLFPQLQITHNLTDPVHLIVLRNMKMAMAASKGVSAELDCLVVQRDPSHHDWARKALDKSSKPLVFCRVLAAVEVKRNPDDLGEAFLSYQKALNWLAGHEQTYDPLTWMNRAYPTGHFKDRPFIHDHDGERLVFTPESFSSLRTRSLSDMDNSGHSNATTDRILKLLSRELCQVSDLDLTKDSGEVAVQDMPLFVDDLYFVTKDGSVEGIHSKASCWATNKIASEVEFDSELSDPEAVEALRLRLNDKYPHRMSTMDLLSLYSALDAHQQILLVGNFAPCDDSS
mmetsp:Transcript_20626/g.28401  ORF Transcript_20626/g.28401 Transcript_20626/m.28401 type:complete len:526 (-) Transcript_20626:58-1635(-)